MQAEVNISDNKQGAVFPAKGGVREGSLDFIRQALSQKCFDAVLMPARMPLSDSFAYALIEDESLLKDAYPLCPIMTVQGA